jgi:prepilin-type processing-associated H-X9-DG protein
MKQLSLGFQQYLNDSGNRYPGAGQFQKWGGQGQAVGTKLPAGVSGGHWVKGDNDTPTGSGGKLAELATPFGPTGKSADVEGGAIFPYVKSVQVYVCPSNPDEEVKKLTYSMSCAVAGMHNVRMTQPSDVIILVDEDSNNDGYWYADDVRGSTDSLVTFHNGGGNLLFADGHAKYFPYKVFPLDNSPQGLANKADMTGTPRFYDRSFGVNGFWEGSAAVFGTCATP